MSHRPTPSHKVRLLLASALLAALLGCGGLNASRPVVEAVSGDWFAVYFTAPHYPDDPAGHADGLDADLMALIDSARESVDVAAYDLDLESVADALIGAQDEDIRVRLVTDGSYADEEAVSRLRDAHISVVARPEEGWGIMHNKFVVVDDTWVWTGSWNLTENGTYRNNNNAVVIASRNLAQDYSLEFEEMFAGHFGPSSPADTPYPLITIREGDRSADIEVYFAPEDEVADRLIQLLASARHNVRFMAYQFTSSPIADALTDLAANGIAVQGVVESRSADDPYSQYDLLRAGGVDVLRDGNQYVMHHKVLIIDDQTVVLGSYNFTNNAEENNDENVLVIHDSEVTAAYLAEFGRVLQKAQTAEP